MFLREAMDPDLLSVDLVRKVLEKSGQKPSVTVRKDGHEQHTGQCR
jgi:hypothetical protein